MSSLLTLGLIGFIGFICQWGADKVKLPAILFLLSAGLLIGPVFNLLDPNELFGELLFPFISLSVAIILFEGALTLKLRELDGIGKPIRQMVTLGVLINATIMTVATYYFTDLSWSMAALFGAIMVVTGPTVIMPMLKTIKPKNKIADVLRWEGIIIDPIGALVAVLVFEWISLQQSMTGVSEIFHIFLTTVLVGLVTGITAGYAFGLLLRKHFIPEKLHNYASLSIVCMVFAISDSLMHESGLLTVTVMGVLLANMRDVHIRSILEFKEDLTLVFVSALFIVLAARLDWVAFTSLSWTAFLLLVTMQFIARPLKVAICFINSNFSWQEQAMIAWIGPRGIVGAAISAVFALRLEELNVPGAEKLVPLAFLIIIGTVVLQSLTAKPIANLLDVAMPKIRGILIIGANPVSIAIAKSLKRENIDNIICDSSWENLSVARVSGLNTYYGNPSSDHASTHLNISPFGYMLGLSSHFEYNLTQANRFREEFGGRNVLVLPPNQSSERFERHIVSALNSARILFSDDTSYKTILKRLTAGAEIKVTEISQEYSYRNWRDNNPNALMLFTVNSADEILFNTMSQAAYAGVGSRLFYLT